MQSSSSEQFRDAYKNAVEMLRHSKPVLAGEQFREILKVFPDEVNSMRMLGVSLVMQGKLDQAIEQFREVVIRAPDFAMAYDDLGGALAEAGHVREAEKYLRLAVKLDPKLTNAWRRLGDLLVKQGRGKEADEAYVHVLNSDPIRKMLAEAKDLLTKGHVFKAEKLYKEIIKRDPQNTEAYGSLATVAVRAGSFRDAERLLVHSLGQNPEAFQNWGLLGHVYRKQDKLEESIDAINHGIEIEPHNAALWASLGSSLAQFLDAEEALDAFRRALELDPNQLGVVLNIGHVQNTLGNNAESIECYKRCLDDEEHRGTAYWYLSNLKTYSFSGEEIRDMEAVLKKTEREEDGFAPFNFALGKAAEDKKDFDRAFRYYEAGNQRKCESVKYDPAVIEAETERMVEVFDDSFFEQREGWGCHDPAPIFVLGLPRSGSTLLEQILASHSAVDGTMELHHVIRTMRRLDEWEDGDDRYPEITKELPADLFRQLGEKYISDTRKYRGDAPYFIDKMPNNFRHIGLIHLMLPNAKIIDARRHPMGACFGNFKQNFAYGQQFTYDLEHLGRYYVNYIRLMDHWDRVLPGKVLPVQYEGTVADTESQIRRILKHCELPFEETCSRFFETKRAVRTPSAEQVRQPIFSTSVEYWRNFDQHLAPLKKALAPVMDRYPVD